MNLACQVAGMLLALVLAWDAPVHAQTTTGARIGEVLAHIESGDYHDAEKVLSGMDMNALPPDLRATLLNLRGSVLNQLGLPAVAYGYLEQSAAAGFDGSVLHLNRGESLYGIGRYDAAEAEFLLYILREPMDSPGFLGLGKTYVAMGRYGEAIEALQLAARLAPDDDVALYYLARAAYLDDQDRLSGETLEHMLANGNVSAIDQALLRRGNGVSGAAGTETADAPKPLSGRIYLSLSDDSNVILLADGFPVPADVDDAGDQAIDLGGGLDWRAYDQGGQLFLLGYQFSTTRYAELDQFDSLQNSVYGSYSRWIDPTILGNVNAGFSALDIDSQSFLGTTYLGLSLAKLLPGDRRLTGYYRATDLDYTAPALTGATDRDGVQQALGLQLRQLLANWTLTAGIEASTMNAEGSDFDMNRYGATFFASRKIADIDLAGSARPLEFNGWISLANADYDQVNTIGNTRRSDDIVQLGASLDLQTSRRLSTVLRLDYLDNGSNIAFYDFDKTRVTLSVIADF